MSGTLQIVFMIIHSDALILKISNCIILRIYFLKR